MAKGRGFSRLLPWIQCSIAAIFGGWGQWQRSEILSHPFFEGTTFWETTARYHVWPWPYKFAAILNMPALLAGVLLTIPIGAVGPAIPEALLLAPSLVFVVFLWFWIGRGLDKRWTMRQMTPWILMAVFLIVCLTGALIPIGYTGFLEYGALLWLLLALTFRRLRKKGFSAGS